MRMARFSAMHRGVVHARDTARRTLRALPAPVRTRLRDVIAWADRWRPAPMIEDWSGPLIGPRSRSEAPRSGLIRATAAITGPDVVSPTRSHDSTGSGGTDRSAVRCLLVTCALDVGGLDEMVAFLARRLPAHGVRTAVLHATSSPSADGEPRGRLGRMLQSQGIEVHEADEGGAPGWIEQWRPDVISGHHAPAWALAAARQLGVPYVDTFHGSHHLFGADWQAEAARGADLSAIVSVCELMRQQYLAGNPRFPPGRVVVIPNGVDDERRSGSDRVAARSRLGLTDEYLFVSLARYCLSKNSYGLLSAFAELARSRPEAHLVIAGRPDNVRYYRQMVRLRDSLPCRDRIHLRDHVAAPAELLAAADGFVLDAFFEGGPLVSMEALCTGVPVVLSEAGMAREQIGADPARGYLVANPLGDPLLADWESMGAACYRPQVNRDELATAMGYLVANREDYLRGRERLAAESAVRFSADACLARHAAVLVAVATGADLPGSDNADAGYATKTGRQVTTVGGQGAKTGSSP
jgi:glycosyltransferase involved in cell wall biosynthesis